jgi:hypothetical protein
VSLPRWEFNTGLHFISIFPVVQQVVGATTILSSTLRIISHVAQMALNKLSDYIYINIFKNKEDNFEKKNVIYIQEQDCLMEEIEMDIHGVLLGCTRIIPIIGSIVAGSLFARDICRTL